MCFNVVGIMMFVYMCIFWVFCRAKTPEQERLLEETEEEEDGRKQEGKKEDEFDLVEDELEL